MKRRFALVVVGILQVVALAALTAQSSQQNPSWVAPDRAASKPNPLAGRPELAGGGRKIFEQRCAQCHGDDAQGTSRAPSLLSRRVRRRPVLEDQQRRHARGHAVVQLSARARTLAITVALAIAAECALKSQSPWLTLERYRTTLCSTNRQRVRRGRAPALRKRPIFEVVAQEFAMVVSAYEVLTRVVDHTSRPDHTNLLQVHYIHPQLSR
jgi:cytochrome c